MSSRESYEAFRGRLDGAAISTFVFAMLAVPIKLWCRTRAAGKSGLSLDDWLCVVTLVFANGLFWLSMLGLRPNLGRDVGTEVSGSTLEEFLIYIYSVGLIYLCGIAFIKFSILAFYWKLFSVAARIPIIIVSVSVGMWLVALLGLCAFQCSPIRAQWTFIPDAKCISPRSMYLGGSLVNVLGDFILVVMPLPYVWRLHAPIGQRLIIAGMFLLGLFVTIVSVIRLTEVLSLSSGDDNTTYNIRDVILWSIVEVNIGLVCACLPSMRRFLSAVGLGRLFSRDSQKGGVHASGQLRDLGSGSNGGGAAARAQEQVHNLSGTGSRSRLTSPGRIWNSMGMAKLDSEEDVYQMIDHAAGNPHGKSRMGVETAPRSSSDTERGGRDSSPHKTDDGSSCHPGDLERKV